MSWHLTPDEFIHLWRETRRDRYPFPLRLRSRTRWQEDHAELTTDLARRHCADPDLSAALRVTADPAITLALTGIRGKPLRLHATIVDSVAITLFQHPGPTPDTGANITIESGTPTLIPKIITGILGDLPAGHTPSRSESRTATDISTQPCTGHGHIEIRRNLQTRTPPTPEFLSWFDIPDDGRYLYRTTANTLAVRPCSTADLAAAIGTLITLSPR
ncbi:hypothetical protein GFY24_32215 [Nocardia sp. SYP-A9097]|uniref:ESX secretion-associated protein EspG n=1 Tax=Nocardia sp. SYP-A9097 TaxID=2663237 RepID=UPI00129A78AC|nr:ESX secretion-associated protein EspG [Nocardia sp. SYP-A9097]MRH92050.1 hypothetical protein [Nocardia sp. SYP-A9097]